MPSAMPYLYFPYDVMANVGIPVSKIAYVGPVAKTNRAMAMQEGVRVNMDAPAEFVYYFSVQVDGRKHPLPIYMPYDSSGDMTDEGLFELVQKERKRLLVILNDTYRQ